MEIRAASMDRDMVPTSASFFQVVDPSTEATHEEPSLVCFSKIHTIFTSITLASFITQNLSSKLELNKTNCIDKCKTHSASKRIRMHGPLQIVPYGHYSSTIRRPMKKCVTLTDLHKVLPNFHEKTQIAFKKALSYYSALTKALS